MHDLLFGVCVAIGFGLGLCLYLYIIHRAGRQYSVGGIMHASAAGAGIGLGVHLLMCAVRPELLVELTRVDGKPINLAEFVIKMDMTHRIHIAAGAVGTILLMAQLLRMACKRE